MFTMSFSGGSDNKECAYNAGYLDLIPELGRSPGERNGNPLQYSWLGNPVDRGDHPWDHRESDRAEWLTFSLSFCLLCCQILIAASSVHWDRGTWVLFTCGHIGKLPQAMKLGWWAHLNMSLLWDISLIVPIVH